MQIQRNGQTLPVIAIFGTKGGVGKSTIARTSAELITTADMGNGRPANVLLVDLDVDARQLSREFKYVHTECPEIHRIVNEKDPEIAMAKDVTSQMKLSSSQNSSRHGLLFFIPSAAKGDYNAYDVGAKIQADELLDILSRAIQKVVDQHDIDCVVLDCMAIIDRYTATAAFLSNVALCITPPEAEMFERVNERAHKIAAICPTFSHERLRVVINRYLRSDRLKELAQKGAIFHAIPFTQDLVEPDLLDPESIRIALFRDNVVRLLELVFDRRWPHLKPPPAIACPPALQEVAKLADKLPQAPALKRLKWLSALRWVAIALAAISIIGLIAASRSATADPGAINASMRPVEVTYLLGTLVHASPKVVSNFCSMTLFVALVLWVIGHLSARRHATFSRAIENLRTGGIVWLMQSLNKNDTDRKEVEHLARLAFSLKEYRERMKNRLTMT